jgi:hypothetical protein
MDRLYKNVKTGEVKPFPPAVYEVVKKHWVLVEEYAKPSIDVLGSLEHELITHEQKEEPTAIQRLILSEKGQMFSSEPTREQLQATYEALSGKKPDGRLSEKKLIQKIEELKETNK